MLGVYQVKCHHFRRPKWIDLTTKVQRSLSSQVLDFIHLLREGQGGSFPPLTKEIDYCIAGNFREVQFLRKGDLQKFRGLIFADGRSRTTPSTIPG